LILTQTFEFKKTIYDISRIYDERIIISFDDRVSEIDFNGSKTKIIDLMLGENAIISPEGKNFLVVGRADEFNNKQLTLYNTQDYDMPLYTTISSDEHFFVKDDGDCLIGYTISENNIKLNFYDEDGIVINEREYKKFVDITINDTGNSFINCGEDGIYILDNQGDEIGNIISFQDFTVPRNDTRIAGFNGEQIFFYENFQEDYRLYIKINELYGLKYAPSGNNIFIWDKDRIYLIDALNYLEEWRQNTSFGGVIVTDISSDSVIENIVCSVLRDWGEAFSPDERYTEPGIIILDENGFERYSQTLNVKGCCPTNIKLDIDTNGINIYLKTPNKLYLFKN
jgi:hypothetical protein